MIVLRYSLKSNSNTLWNVICMFFLSSSFYCVHMVRTVCFNLHIIKRHRQEKVYKCTIYMNKTTTPHSPYTHQFGSVHARAQKKREVAWTRTRQMLLGRRNNRIVWVQRCRQVYRPFCYYTKTCVWVIIVYICIHKIPFIINMLLTCSSYIQVIYI